MDTGSQYATFDRSKMKNFSYFSPLNTKIEKKDLRGVRG